MVDILYFAENKLGFSQLRLSLRPCDASLTLFMQRIALIVTATLVTLGLLAWGYPTYQVWQKAQKGRADLAEANFNRQIQVAEAAAKQERGDTSVIYLPGDSFLPFAQSIETSREV